MDFTHSACFSAMLFWLATGTLLMAHFLGIPFTQSLPLTLPYFYLKFFAQKCTLLTVHESMTFDDALDTKQLPKLAILCLCVCAAQVIAMISFSFAQLTLLLNRLWLACLLHCWVQENDNSKLEKMKAKIECDLPLASSILFFLVCTSWPTAQSSGSSMILSLFSLSVFIVWLLFMPTVRSGAH